MKSRSEKSLPRYFWLCILLWFSCVFPSHAQAQVSVAGGSGDVSQIEELPRNLTPQQVRDLVARLSDAEVRQLIITQLDRQAAAQPREPEADAYMQQLRSGIQMASESIGQILSSRDQLRQQFAAIWHQVTAEGRIDAAYLLYQFAGLLLVGWACTWLARRLFEKPRPDAAVAGTTTSSISRTSFGFVSGLLRLAAFGLGALIFVSIFSRHSPVTQGFWSDLVWCLVLIGFAMLVVRGFRQLGGADRRPDDHLFEALIWAAVLTAALVLPEPLIGVALAAGIGKEDMLLLNILFGALFVGPLILLLVRLRNYGADLILGVGESPGSIRQGFARCWWVLAIVYLLVIWMFSIGRRAATGESSLLPGLGSLVLVGSLPYIDRGLTRLITWYFSSRDSGEEGSAVVIGETPVYITTALRYARVLLMVLVLSIFVSLWNIDLRAISAQLVGPTVASALFDISITVLLTWALWGMIRISIERKLDESKPADDGEGESEAGGLGGSRVETVLPLIRVSIKITLIVMAVLISLSSLGVNIGPLIAGAGVVGIAVGFGAQTLVRDIVSGFFYLIDDAFRIGEYVEIDAIRGTVEKISVRSFQLRHHNGPVHTIPYGEIRSLTNWSRDWAIMKFELRIPFETDIDQVRKIIKKIGIDMMESEQFGPLMLAPLKSQGVNRMDDSALIIRCKFTAVPGQQYLIRREAFTRIQRAFEEQGIHFAPRRVLVEATGPDDAAKAAAAAGALDQETPPGDTSKP